MTTWTSFVSPLFVWWTPRDLMPSASLRVTFYVLGADLCSQLPSTMKVRTTKTRSWSVFVFQYQVLVLGAVDHRVCHRRYKLTLVVKESQIYCQRLGCQLQRSQTSARLSIYHNLDSNVVIRLSLETIQIRLNTCSYSFQRQLEFIQSKTYWPDDCLWGFREHTEDLLDGSPYTIYFYFWSVRDAMAWNMRP